MNYYRSEFKVGILVFVSVVFLLIFVFSIGSFQLFRPTKDIKIYFQFVNGLVKNAPVRYAGVEIGRVKNIRIVDNGEEVIGKKKRVEVTARILDTVFISKNAQASINTLGLLGEKYVELNSTGKIESELLEEGDAILGERLVQVSELLKMGKNIISSLEKTMLSIENIVADAETKEKLKAVVNGSNNVVSNLEKITNSFHDILKKNEVSINNTVENLEAVTVKLQKFLDNADDLVLKNKEDIRQIIINLKQTSESAKIFADKIEKSPSSLMWKSREERKREIEEKKAEVAGEYKVVTKKGRVVPAHVAKKRN